MTTSPAPTVGRLASVSLDCPDPSALADFYGALLDLPRAYESPDGRVVSLSDGGMAVTMMRAANRRAADLAGAGSAAAAPPRHPRHRPRRRGRTSIASGDRSGSPAGTDGVASAARPGSDIPSAYNRHRRLTDLAQNGGGSSDGVESDGAEFGASSGRPSVRGPARRPGLVAPSRGHAATLASPSDR